jgi:hypothetical protein
MVATLIHSLPFLMIMDFVPNDSNNSSIWDKAWPNVIFVKLDMRSHPSFVSIQANISLFFTFKASKLSTVSWNWALTSVEKYLLRLIP